MGLLATDTGHHLGPLAALWCLLSDGIDVQYLEFIPFRETDKYYSNYYA